MKLIRPRKRQTCCGGCEVPILPGCDTWHGTSFDEGPQRWWMHPVCDDVATATGWYDRPYDDRWPLAEVAADELAEPLRSAWIAHRAQGVAS